MPKTPAQPPTPPGTPAQGLDQLVQSLDAIVWEADPRTLRFSFVSRRAGDILGFAPDHWISEPGFFASRIHDEDREDVVAAYREAVRTGVDHNLEYRVIAADGHTVWVRDRVQVERGEHGEPLSLRGIMVEVTARRTAETRLQDSEERYRRLVEHSPDAIMVHSDGIIVFANMQAASLLGATDPDDLIGMPAVDLVHPDSRESVATRMREEEAGTSVGLLQERFIRRDGSTVDVEVAGIPFRYNGKPAGQIVARDISQRVQIERRLHDTEEKFQTLVEHIPAILYIDHPGISDETIYISPQIEHILGISAQAWMHDDDLWETHLHPDDRDAAVGAYRSGVAAGEPFSSDYRLVTPKGTFWIRDDAVVLTESDGLTIVQGVMFDITEQKLAEAALIATGQREREAGDRLRELDSMKNTFLAAVSHELRSPLTAVLGLALTLEQQDLDADDRADLVHRLASNARKLDRLLTDLLDLDRLSRGAVALSLHQTDIGALVQRTVELTDVLHPRHVTVEAPSIFIAVDGAKVERIVENLLVNTTRHAGHDARVWVRVEGRSDGAEIVVEDDGPGIPPDIREAIFEPFRQGPTNSAHSPGTGIGLSLVREFSTLHRGKAWAEEREGGGASFHVFLPNDADDTD